MDHLHYNSTKNPMLTGALGRCPRCQQGSLFSGVLTLAPRCEVCGLDYSFADPADGPAFFAMTIAAVVPAAVLAAAMALPVAALAVRHPSPLSTFINRLAFAGYAVPALAFALWQQLNYEPPIWVHLFTTLPLTLGACLALLRPLKGWLVCSQFFHKAEEGSIDFEWHERRREELQSKGDA